VRLEAPPDREVRRTGGSTALRAVARWRRHPKDREVKEGGWLRFEKGEVITNISCEFDSYCPLVVTRALLTQPQSLMRNTGAGTDPTRRGSTGYSRSRTWSPTRCRRRLRETVRASPAMRASLGLRRCWRSSRPYEGGRRGRSARRAHIAVRIRRRRCRRGRRCLAREKGMRRSNGT